jgi:hypothetical protein
LKAGELFQGGTTRVAAWEDAQEVRSDTPRPGEEDGFANDDVRRSVDRHLAESVANE